MIRKLQRYSFQEHPDIAPTLLQIESKLEVMEAEKRIRRSRQSSFTVLILHEKPIPGMKGYFEMYLLEL
ncbi:hypothetical protein T03_10305 [Trichinella britovi]|uniref:Uncharacterized protein n=1 Tax=Trichinella britovi TaxID=45882 RepID=A0A0V0ZJS7_TRIBR|nr:hypothetical protein T03_10305 [Trichinella britovi]